MANVGREGYYGWFGLGGSSFVYNPTYQIGFAYVPGVFNMLDIFNTKAAELEGLVLDIASGNYTERIVEQSGCSTCTTF